MKVRIARIAKRMHNKFRGLYWRQMFVTVGMVLLTLFLLGVSFFSLSYNYARGQAERGAGRPRPRWWGSSPPAIWKTGGTWTWRSCSSEEDFQQSGLLRRHGVRGGLPDLRRGGPRAAVHGCDLSDGLVVTMPEDMTRRACMEEGILLPAARTWTACIPASGSWWACPAVKLGYAGPPWAMVFAVSATTRRWTPCGRGFVGPVLHDGVRGR